MKYPAYLLIPQNYIKTWFGKPRSDLVDSGIAYRAFSRSECVRNFYGRPNLSPGGV